MKKRIEEMNMRSGNALEEEHSRLTSEISKLLKINQELRNELEKSNTNVENVHSNIIEADRLKLELRKQTQALALASKKIETLEV